MSSHTNNTDTDDVGLDADMPERMITLVSNDPTKTEFTLPLSNAMMSNMISQAYEEDKSNEDEPIPAHVPKDNLALIVNYMNLHGGTHQSQIQVVNHMELHESKNQSQVDSNNEKHWLKIDQLSSPKFSDICYSKDWEFFKDLQLKQVVSLMASADLMAVLSLIEVCGAYIAYAFRANLDNMPKALANNNYDLTPSQVETWTLTPEQVVELKSQAKWIDPPTQDKN